ncbi:uncharacterized protein LOC118379274, partial [Oncorhynchus keta]|uniref:uncharacterized protein LOC118379274 n=1 Tax=Oncorhynchus keta TaxID=8018 RepID=UPI00227D4350
ILPLMLGRLPPLPPSPTFTPVEEEEKTGNPVEKERREPSSVPETGEAVLQGEEMHKEGRAEMLQGEEMHKEGRAESTFLDTESPFKKHAPIKTSSPMMRQEGDEDKDRTASPLLLTCDEDDDEDDHGPVKQPITALTPQCNRQAADGKLTLSLCSIETEPEEPPQTSLCPAVEPKEQPVTGKKSLARPSEMKSLARPSEMKSLARPSEKKSLARPSEKKSLARPSEKKSLARPSEKEESGPATREEESREEESGPATREEESGPATREEESGPSHQRRR